MDVFSWFRRSKTTTTSAGNGQINKQEPKSDSKTEEELFGVTDQLIDFIKTFTVETFKNFPLQDEEAANCDGGTPSISGNVRKDLSDWQERHAILVLSKVKEMSQLRFRLCPGWMKERQFWRIYFTLVKSYTAEYELRAVQLARLRQMSIENENAPNTSAYEVEMSETKPTTSNLDSLTHDIESGKE
ncbi:hypothetical protein Vadar_013500 [Vaccinium darrowii]|uniref:Uncharacterized protein n=1 Tax=Vaccinium darrowii TaxID=229202 RepID=A0ACB7XA18_9ERIC|nr:hypothetical protein Vadar_013500 [Vaccinium darrowii]